MTDYQSRLKTCTIHGAYLSDSCPRCNTISHTNYSYCKTHKLSYRGDCPKCVSQSQLSLEYVQPLRVKKRGKNKWRYRGLKFDSQDEALRYGYLADLQDVGVIRHLCIQPMMVLRPSFELAQAHYVKRKGGKPRTIPAETYTPDYAYIYGKLLIIEDVKGMSKGKPYSKANSDRSQKHLLYHYRHKPHVVFMLVTQHGAFWRYWQASRGYPELDFQLTNHERMDKAS